MNQIEGTIPNFISGVSQQDKYLLDFLSGIVENDPSGEFKSDVVADNQQLKNEYYIDQKGDFNLIVPTNELEDWIKNQVEKVQKILTSGKLYE